MVKGLGSSGKRKVGKPSFVRRFMRHKSGMFGFVLTSLFVLMALFGPLIAPYNPNQPNYAQIMAGPSMVHLLGTDIFGRDTLSRVLFGARLSLGIGVGATLIGAIIGGLWGLWSGYVGGLWDVLSMRIVDILLAFPGILLAIGIIAITGPGIGPVIIATGIFGIPIFARLVRGSVLAVKERAFIEAARALGSANTRVMFRHLMPSVILPILVYVTLRVGTVILIASGLSFLGFGVQPPVPEWGAMLSSAQLYLPVDPLMAFAPGIAISLAVLGLNLLGDGLSDTLDPKLGR